MLGSSVRGPCEEGTVGRLFEEAIALFSTDALHNICRESDKTGPSDFIAQGFCQFQSILSSDSKHSHTFNISGVILDLQKQHFDLKNLVY